MSGFDTSRNFLFIDQDKQQKKIAETKLLFGGVGLGSVIAEVAVRMGFQHFVLIDYDDVELHNLNRQNYTFNDGQNKELKVEAIKRRLLDINPNLAGNIKTFNLKITQKEDITGEMLEGVDIAINALDYDSGAPIIFDEACLDWKKPIPIIHPINISWAATAFVIPTEVMGNTDAKYILDYVKHEVLKIIAAASDRMDILDKNIGTYNGDLSALHIIYFLITQIRKNYKDIPWYTSVVNEYMKRVKEIPDLYMPQIAVGANLVAGQTMSIIFDLLFRKGSVRFFPHVNFLSNR